MTAMLSRAQKLELISLLEERDRRSRLRLVKQDSEKLLADFYEFRKRVSKMRFQKFLEGWWQREVAKHVQQFYADFKAGKRPKLIIKSPPQHGKSWQLIDAIAWLLANDPKLRLIFASYSDRLGERANREQQKTFQHEDWLSLFPKTTITVPPGFEGVKPKVNQELVEIYQGGYFRNTTIGGPINGESLDIGLIDDPIKGREAANSETVREKTWDWFTDDFFTRFSEHAGFICIGTNWHVDDPIQRMIDKFPDVKVVSYPAIAIEDEMYRKKGEALFPELKSIEFLEERKGLMPIENWMSLYQQNPIVAGGNKFKDTMIEFCDCPSDFDYEFIIVDTAYKSKKENDWTVATLFGVKSGRLYVPDVWRVKIDASEMEVPLEAFIRKHKKYKFRNVWIEPKGHGIYLNQKFKSKGLGIPSENDLKEFFKDRKLDKVERANNAIPHLSDKKIYISNLINEKEELKAELLAFPNGKHDDFADTVIDGIKRAYGRALSILDVL